jgi:branched-chain amino acid transport system permease protein
MNARTLAVRTRSVVRDAAVPTTALARVGLRSPESQTVAEGERPFLGSWLSTGAVVLGTVVVLLWSSGAGLYVQTVVGLYASYLVAALGYNLVLGYAGQFAFCQNAFMAIGAYAYAVGFTRIGTVPALLVAVLLTPMVGALVGLAVLRTREIYLALITLAFSQATALAIQLWDPTQGDDGILVLLGGTSTYALAIVAAGLALLVALRIVRSPLGRAMALVRTDEAAAAAMGVDVTRVRVTAFALSGLYGGVGGVLLAATVTFVTPTNFTLELTLMLLTMIVVGGVASIWGTVVGVLVIVLIRQNLPSVGELGSYIDAAVLFAILVVRPRGLASLVRVRRRSARA